MKVRDTVLIRQKNVEHFMDLAKDPTSGIIIRMRRHDRLGMLYLVRCGKALFEFKEEEIEPMEEVRYEGN